MVGASSIRKALLKTSVRVEPNKPRRPGAVHAPPYSLELSSKRNVLMRAKGASVGRRVEVPQANARAPQSCGPVLVPTIRRESVLSFVVLMNQSRIFRTYVSFFFFLGQA